MPIANSNVGSRAGAGAVPGRLNPMQWSLRYAIKSYLLSAIWIAPVVAVVLEQLTFRIAYIHQLEFGFIPGFAIG